MLVVREIQGRLAWLFLDGVSDMSFSFDANIILEDKFHLTTILHFCTDNFEEFVLSLSSHKVRFVVIAPAKRIVLPSARVIHGVLTVCIATNIDSWLQNFVAILNMGCH